MTPGQFRAVLITDPLIVLATAVVRLSQPGGLLFDATGKRQIAIARSWACTLLPYLRRQRDGRKVWNESIPTQATS